MPGRFRIPTIRSVRGQTVLRIAVIIVSLLLQWLMLEYSMNTSAAVWGRSPLLNLLNLCVVGAFDGVILLAAGRIRLTLLLTDFSAFFVAFCNCYIYDLHGAPIRLSELANLFTGLAVSSGYRFTLLGSAKTVLLMYALSWILLLLEKRLCPGKENRVCRRRLAGLLSALVMAGGVTAAFAEGTYRPELGYSWNVSSSTSGYPLCLVEDALQFFSVVVTPEGYSTEAAQEAAARYPETEAVCDTLPDVVLILNETFYDPAVYTSLELETDEEYLSNFYSLTGVERGLCVASPGGTNSSEFELLTSVSRALVNANAPFNFISFTGADTVVSYMNSLGYETWALHGMGGANYTRYKAYPEMNFDHILFGEDFQYVDRNGNRYRTDATDYLQLIDCYESSGDGPRFLYLLTYQNHGGWEQNPDEDDTVHCLTDLGSLTDDMSEYLSSIRLSDQALTGLLEYFSTVDRPVLLVMVGDHAPVFLTTRNDQELLEDSGDGHTLQYLRQTATPYLIWSNTGALETEYEEITMTDLVPMALRAAGMPLTSYYSALLTLQSEYPVHVKSYAVDTEGSLLRLEKASDWPDSLRDCLYLGCNQLTAGTGRPNCFRLSEAGEESK